MSVLGVVALGAQRSASLRLPRELAPYRAWGAVWREPRAIPFALWMRCVPASEANWERARKTTGPHTRRFIQVYANAAARPALRDPSHAEFPVGSIIAKEKLIENVSREPDGVAFMVKRAGTAFRSTGGWEFLYYPSRGDRRATHLSCAGCHSAEKGYVLGAYDGRAPDTLSLDGGR